MKAIVKSVKATTRINPTTGETIEAFRPSVVTITEFVNSLVMQGELKPLSGELPDTASDMEFKKFYIESKKDVELAVDSYVSKLVADEEAKNPAKPADAAKPAVADKPAEAVKPAETAKPAGAK